ncbi:PREDICTED: uncharacterized protein LOC104719746 isoform X1 [Camelina sativa]|uniref:Uncharacterized protein LOC104719746 isoform X1 n=1 Tax=Camelina sativa TaxID=90675 RepID=A0ABM0U589_CAMSA|nr:PREDICTED: uncharacterized protein LOC104719746 isoform X1 [Camelina sativa]
MYIPMLPKKTAGPIILLGSLMRIKKSNVTLSWSVFYGRITVKMYIPMLPKKTAGPIILLGNLTRIKKFNGKVSVQNSRFSTKLFLDGDLSEIAEFKMQLGNRDSNDVHRVSQLMTPDLSNKVEDSFPLSSWESIDQITKTSQENTCVTFARILEF